MANGKFWGGQNSSKEYVLALAGTLPTTKPELLVGHSLTNFNNEQIDRVTAVVVELERGRIREKQVVVRQAIQTGVTGTIGLGARGEIYTPLLQKILRGNCQLNLYIKRTCTPNDEWGHFYALLNATFNPPTFVNDIVTTDDSTNFVTKQAEFQATDMILSFVVGAFVLTDVTPPLWDVAALTAECSDCDEGAFQDFVVVGGIGCASNAAYVGITHNRFGSVTNPTHNIPNGNAAKAVYASGDIILVGFSDDPVPVDGATGGTVFSPDGGATFTIDSNLTGPIHAVAEFDGQYLAAGGVGGAAATLFVSDDGTAWTPVASANLPADETITGIAVDVENEYIILVGTGGTVLKGTKSGSSIQLSVLIPTGVSTTDLFAVAVFGPDHFAVGGATKFYAETTDGGTTWLKPVMPGTGTIKGLAGLSFVRTVVGIGTGGLADRTVMTDNSYKLLSVANGGTIGGDITSLTNGDGEYDYFVATTDDGEVVMLHPFSPGA